MPFHNTRQTATLHGYTIPKDTYMMYSMYSIHMSPKHFDEPREFRPERFLDQKGHVTRPEAFLPFGIGEYTTITLW